MEFYTDDTSESELCAVPTILRIHLRRSVKSLVTAGSALRLELSYSSEFCDSVPLLLGKHTVMAVFVKGNNISASELLEAVFSLKSFEVLLEGSESLPSRLSLTVPNEIGFHQLFFFNKRLPPSPGSENRLLKPLILPLLTGCFNVISQDQVALVHSAVPVLTNYRIFSGILIEEDYGRTLGSHIYDSSVSIIRYLSRQKVSDGSTALKGSKSTTANESQNSQHSVALELGAGCGLVSIWLSKESTMRRVIATDKACQLPLMTRNIARNGAQDRCSASELDWSTFALDDKDRMSPMLATDDSRGTKPVTTSIDFVDDPNHSEKCCSAQSTSASIKAISSSPSEADVHHQRNLLHFAEDEKLSLIVAGDVLYSRSLAEDFFSVVREVAVPDVTVILVAQKLRNQDQRDTLDVRSFLGLRSEIVWEEANVIIWKMFVIPRTD
jgi:predicted nicotinamide N-methyase